MTRYGEAVGRLSDAILGTPGDLDPAIRAAIEAYAADLPERPRGIPPDLLPYVEKVARHAHTIVDADVERLRAAGFSEDAILEATLAAALGAARGRLGRGLTALGG